ncbi:MAG: peptidoglycan-associated lipoprotein Pal [Terracidiphilus sp.]
MDRRNRILVPVVLLVAVIAVAGCKKKVTPPPAPTAPPVVVPAPTAKITASPTVITAGDNVVLTWSTTNAATASIDGLGDLPTSGVKTVTPTVSTDYHLVAKGPGGTADASVRVTVNAAPVVATTPVSAVSAEDEFKANVQDIFFDYDKYDVRSDAQGTLAHDAAYFTSHPNVKILIAGYCDERGSDEYNLALGQNRAESIKKGLINAGVAASRLRVISYGKEKPFCTESTESCWQKNRRAGFSLDR